MSDIELTILMPCLNEEKTVAFCIEEAKRFISENSISAEILIADNGSTDNSPKIAEEHGARVVFVPEKGYGNALFASLFRSSSAFPFGEDKVSDECAGFSLRNKGV